MINYDKTPSSWIIIFIFENNKERTEKIFDNNEYKIKLDSNKNTSNQYIFHYINYISINITL